MTPRTAETIYVQVGVARKRRLKRACKVAKLSQAKIVSAAIDRELLRLAAKHPQLQERRNGHSEAGIQ